LWSLIAPSPDRPLLRLNKFFVINYPAMKHLKLFICVMLVTSGFSACTVPPESTGSANSNASPTNSNSAAKPEIARATPPALAPTPTPLKVEPATQPATQPVPQPTPLSPATVKPANSNSGAAASAVAAGVAEGRVPHLIAPTKKIDFGKQPQDKSLVRSVVIKNGGRADLNIESVVPS
jgi:hypothetical protein